MVFAACVSFVLPVWDTPIDFRPDVASAPTLVRLLADKTGLKLTTNLNVANDIVGFVAPSATPREIMDQLAYTIDAKWVEAGGEWTLVRTQEQSTAQKTKSFEDAIKLGLARASRTLRNVRSAWVKEQHVRCDDQGAIAEYQVNMMVTFVLDD